MQDFYDTWSTIEGLVTDFSYEHDATDFKVATVLTDGGEEWTIVGSLPNLCVGEHIEARGRFVDHPTYGPQFKVHDFENTMPKTREALISYLGSGALKGIGPTLARRIAEKFSEDEIRRILECEPERLAEVKGISLNMAMMVGEEYHEHYALQEVTRRLIEHGITPSLSKRLFARYGERTVDQVLHHPYALADHVRGIGFKRADRIASSLGIEPNDPERIRAAILYVLSTAAEDGHVYLADVEIKDRLRTDLGIDCDEAELDNQKTGLVMEGKAVERTVQGQSAVYLTYLYNAEMSVASHLVSLMDRPPKAILADLDAAARACEVKLAPEQQEAIQTAMASAVTVITGGPGTGKTTILNVLLRMLDELRLDYLLCAPTGRAAKRMSEATGRDAKTIHRLLELQGNPEEPGRMEFGRNADHPLETDVLVVDEMSMVDILLMQQLLQAVTLGTRVILVGDCDQLPSVGPGSVLKDIVRSECVPTVRLTKIFRQQKESLIVSNAHAILNGEYPQTAGDGDYFEMLPKGDWVSLLVSLVRDRLPKYLHCNSRDDIQILTPNRKGPLGVDALNKALQQALNAPMKTKDELEYQNTIFRVGDKVMQIRNDYALVWRVKNEYGLAIDEGVGVFNGDIGRVEGVDKLQKMLTVRFDDKHEVVYDYADLEELDLAYAMTIHKAQGSECPAVILALPGGSPMLYCRNLLYTGLTRAQKLAVVIGRRDVICGMVTNDRPMLRNSTLAAQIKGSYDIGGIG